VADLGRSAKIMKKIQHLLLPIGLLALVGCSTPSLVTLTPDPVTGKETRKEYTKYYDAGAWLVPGHLGMSVVVDQMSEFSGKITVYAWNRDKEKHAIKIQSVSSGYKKAVIGRSELVAVADDRTGLEVGTIEVSSYATFIEVVVAYELDGVAGETALRLERRTPEELERYFGKNGRAPYPWFHDQ